MTLGKEESFERFFKENYSKFCFYALRYVDDEDACRDIVSSGFEYVWKRYGLNDVDNWANYMLSYIRNKCIDHIRHDAVHKKYADFYMSVTSPHTESYDEQEERIALMGGLIDTLPPKTRLVLQECFLNKKKYKEVAEELEVSVSAVHKHIMKALRILREGVKNK